jgi:hypothetical protein
MLERLRWLFATVDRPTFRNVAAWDDSDISQESK